MDRTKALHVIQRLLSHAESTQYPDEAARYLERAQELMVKYAIAEEALRSRGASREDVICAHIEIADRTPLANAKRYLAGTVARHTRCRLVVLSGRGRVAVVGVESDVGFVESLYTSLLLQMSSAMEHDAADARAGGVRVDRTWRNSYAWGFAGRVDARMAETDRRIEQETGRSSELVFAGRTKEVSDTFAGMFGTPRSMRVSLTVDRDGQDRGRSAGESANLTGGSRGLRQQDRLEA